MSDSQKQGSESETTDQQCRIRFEDMDKEQLADMYDALLLRDDTDSELAEYEQVELPSEKEILDLNNSRKRFLQSLVPKSQCNAETQTNADMTDLCDRHISPFSKKTDMM
ncbi:hypothetical protein KR026_007624 [Drosophila bipectinata]|nr:hypothetical protein KR026_007624 [Drosophila bipectinata]